MIKYDKEFYLKMIGNITAEKMYSSPSCIGQCTGCMCNCRCSCSGGINADFDWEEI